MCLQWKKDAYQAKKYEYRAYGRQFYQDNKERLDLKAKEYRSKYPEKKKNTALKTKFGITLDYYNELLNKQNGVCAICFKTDKRSLAVDHCHKTGRIRGLLCGKCNKALGLLNDDLATIEKIKDYLK